MLVRPLRIAALERPAAQCRLVVAIAIATGGFTPGCSTVTRPVDVRASDVGATSEAPATIRAQSGDAPAPPVAPGSPESPSPALPADPTGALPESPSGAVGDGAVGSPPAGTPVPPVVTGALDTMIESLFGEASTSNWTPLYLSDLFTQGWNQPFVFSPPSDSGALRQEWLNASNGVFYRQWTLDYNYRSAVPPRGNADIGTWGIFAPLSRRLELYITVPFVDYRVVADPAPASGPASPINRSAAASSTSSYKATFGDVTFTPQVLLHETQNTSIMSLLAIETPTGSTAAGNGNTSLGPQIQFWQGLPNRWVIRGGAGPTIPLTPTGLRTTFDTNLTIGRFLTLDEVRYFKELTVWLAVNNAATTDNRGPAGDTLTILPGMRVRVAANTFLLYGVEIPLVAPRDEAFGMYFTLVQRW
jgi:Putative MetA-pathway of phenol degradation